MPDSDQPVPAPDASTEAASTESTPLEDATVIRHDQVRVEQFPEGATYRTLVGEGASAGGGGESQEVRIGIQTSPPGYATPHHSHPYTEILTILEGEGVAWMDGADGETELRPGTTVVLPAHVRHGFRVTGDTPLVTYGLHVSADRQVYIHDDSDPASGHPK